MLTPDSLIIQDGGALHLFMINYGQIENQETALIKAAWATRKENTPRNAQLSASLQALTPGTNLRQSNVKMEATLRRLKDCLLHILIACAIKQTHLVLMSLESCTFCVSHMPLC